MSSSSPRSPEVHRDGPLWRVVRASMSLVGFVPPIPHQAPAAALPPWDVLGSNRREFRSCVFGQHCAYCTLPTLRPYRSFTCDLPVTASSCQERGEKGKVSTTLLVDGGHLDGQRRVSYARYRSAFIWQGSRALSSRPRQGTVRSLSLNQIVTCWTAESCCLLRFLSTRIPTRIDRKMKL